MFHKRRAPQMLMSFPLFASFHDITVMFPKMITDFFFPLGIMNSPTLIY